MHPKKTSFHAHHAPMGALSSFTCGAHNAKGGMGVELDSAYPGAITVGYYDSANTFHTLPLSEGEESESERYIDENKIGTCENQRIIKNISREYFWASDRIFSPQVSFEIITPFFSIPDPNEAHNDELAFACCPVIQLRIHFNNTTANPVRGVFALGINHRWSSIQQQSKSTKLIGACSQDTVGFASNTPDALCFIDFDACAALNRQHTTPEFLLGPTAGLEVQVKANSIKTLDVVLGFYKAGPVTYNQSMCYYYTQHFDSLLDVLEYGLQHREDYLDEATVRNQELSLSTLTDDQKFLIAHATKSYYGSTQWLWDGNKSVWVVNEGEYMMMNTFDLTVDMLFFEMRFNPWTVKNVLDYFVDHYSFYDKVFDPVAPNTLYDGGISFTHDMGVMNHWSPEGSSAYEASGLDRACFSHMTCEQLTNWVLCAGVYYHKTLDTDFLKKHETTLKDCLHSLLNRDNPIPRLRNGIMSFESDRTKGGGEITTYDSLDHSLGQARQNIYLAGKMWASFVLLESLFGALDRDIFEAQAKQSALRTAKALTESYRDDLGYIPAILDGKNTSAIIPAIEALAYPFVAGLTQSVSEDGPYSEYIGVLKKHFRNIMNKDLCLYDDGGWKLSSSTDNSWASKIALSQFVAKDILGFDLKKISPNADQTHARWQQEGATLHACSDQFKSGKAIGSLYYPRIVTNILWMG